MNILNYLFDPETTALDWLWGTMLIHIVLGLLTTSPVVGILFLIHISIIGIISMYHLWMFFKSMGEWIEQMQEVKNG